MDVNLAGIIYDSIVDGPGLRCVIFFQGCNHHCYNCHNMQTHSNEDNIIMNIDELINQIKNNKTINKITISGGEPFLQYEQLLVLAQAFKNYDLWIYSGYTKKELIRLGYSSIFKYISVLVDGPYIEELRTLNIPFIGSSNQNIITFNKGNN
ncbi:MAG: anaerobic ribonucleoside-triphosphate reductase activating protein [Bacilli bacterium]|jgi:anaerobic ribonucleoside-triphosphate reductase activating protein|nr:anaerobic ribonucleoside-triphosphate reductase activating protein [Bacilli bacterium]